MDEQIPVFLAVTGIEDETVARQYLEITGGDLEYAVTLYMESNPPQAANTHANDEEMAQRMQQEAYGGGGPQEVDDVREADANIHRHETLVDSFGGMSGGGFYGNPQPPRPADIFGTRGTSIFNQMINRENEIHDDFEDEGDSDDDYHETNNDDIIVLDSDEEPERELSRRRRDISSREDELTSTQRRLANLFRPPFDIMSIIDLDSAKAQGKTQHKWILINIQDSSEFRCQVLNRDFWSNSKVKAIVKESFIFLQYQNDSGNGINYLNFYSTEEVPHIAILDPLTGERVHKWKDGEVPQVDQWVEEVEEFLSKFSLVPGSNNPMVKHEVVFDPDALSEEQQIEFAMKQSIADSNGKSVDKAISLDSEEETTIKPEEEEEVLSEFEKIQPVNHVEPENGATVTRIQIRFPNGKRLIHKVDMNDKIIAIFEWLKYILAEKPEEYGVSNEDKFNLSNGSNKAFKFIDSLEVTVEEANLRNASILLEKE
jgi:hypothetical protein